MKIENRNANSKLVVVIMIPVRRIAVVRRSGAKMGQAGASCQKAEARDHGALRNPN